MFLIMLSSSCRLCFRTHLSQTSHAYTHRDEDDKAQNTHYHLRAIITHDLHSPDKLKRGLARDDQRNSHSCRKSFIYSATNVTEKQMIRSFDEYFRMWMDVAHKFNSPETTYFYYDIKCFFQLNRYRNSIYCQWVAFPSRIFRQNLTLRYHLWRKWLLRYVRNYSRFHHPSRKNEFQTSYMISVK